MWSLYTQAFYHTSGRLYNNLSAQDWTFMNPCQFVVHALLHKKVVVRPSDSARSHVGKNTSSRRAGRFWRGKRLYAHDSQRRCCEKLNKVELEHIVAAEHWLPLARPLDTRLDMKISKWARTQKSGQKNTWRIS